jgi:hypothetical protein
MRLAQEIDNHVLLGVIDAEQSTIQSGIASLNQQLQMKHNCSRAVIY